MPSEIFPLTFTPFEHFCYALARPQAAMTFWGVFYFKGNIHRDVFQQALEEVLKRHPLFQSLARGEPEARTEEIFWEYAPRELPWTDWGNWETPVEPPHGGYIDLRREVGLRIFIRERDNETKMYLQAHHSCCDGLRFSEFFDELLSIYARLHPDTVEKPKLPPQNLELLKERGKFRFGRLTRMLMFPKNILHLLKLLKQDIAGILPAQHGKGYDGGFCSEPSYVTHTFSEVQSQVLRAAAKSQGLSLNDLCLRDLFLTLMAWNNTQAGDNGANNFRIAVPTDLSYALKSPMPSANKVGMIFLDRKIARSISEEELLWGIHREMRRLRRWNLGYSFVRAFEVLGWKEARLVNTLNKARFFPTIYFTNLGSLFHGSSLMGPEGRLKAGNLELMDADSIAPSLIWSPVNLIAASYGGRLKLCLQYNGQKVASDQAHQFINLLVRQINHPPIN